MAEKGWEYVPSVSNLDSWFKEKTERMKVPGGWLVRTTLYKEHFGMFGAFIGGRSSLSTSVTFYPDPSHEWNAFA